MLVGIPDLYLGGTAEVDTAVAAGVDDFPIHQHLEIAVVFDGSQAIAFTVEDQDPVLNGPMFVHQVVSYFLGLGELSGGKFSSFDRVVVGSGEQAFPAGEVFTVIKSDEAGRWLVEGCRGGFNGFQVGVDTFADIGIIGSSTSGV